MAQLALFGGPKTVSHPFPTWPQWDQQEADALLRTLNTGKWWMYAYGDTELGETEAAEGKVSQVELAEREFARLHGVKHCLAVNSGTMALDICMRAIGLKGGDEVITTPYTFFATSSCILNAGAWPIYVDIDPDTYNIDPRKIEAAITPRTRAILPVHFAGEMCDIEAICDIARRHNIVVVEDAAQAQGVCLQGERYAGSFGAMSIFSLQASKCLTCGEGGLITTNDDRLAEIVWSLRHCGRRRAGVWYEHERRGWNCRMNEFTAAVLRMQMRKMPAQNQRRVENVTYLFDKLREVGGLTPIKLHPKATKRNHYLVILRYDPAGWGGLSRKHFLAALNAEGVPAVPGYSFGNYGNPVFDDPALYEADSPWMRCRKSPPARDYARRCPNTVRACEQEAIWLTQNLFLGDRSQMDLMVQAGHKIRSNLGSLLSHAATTRVK